jgi:hypothetical protein
VFNRSICPNNCFSCEFDALEALAVPLTLALALAVDGFDLMLIASPAGFIDRVLCEALRRMFEYTFFSDSRGGSFLFKEFMGEEDSPV